MGRRREESTILRGYEISMMTYTPCSPVSVVGGRDHTLIRSWARTDHGRACWWSWWMTLARMDRSVIGKAEKNEESDWPREEELKKEFYLSK